MPHYTPSSIKRRLRAVAAAIGSVRAEGLNPSQVTVDRLNAFARGELSGEELERLTLADAKGKVA